MKSILAIVVCIGSLLPLPLSGQAPATQPNLPAQALGPNDLIGVAVYDSPELTRTVRVGADGTIRLPMLHRAVRASGLLPADLEQAIAQALVAEQIVLDPHVTITVVEYHSRPISVAGAVKTPVTFQAVGPVSLLEALTRAGGPAATAGQDVLVAVPSRGDREGVIRRIPIRQLIEGEDPTLNLTLEGGEEVRVPEIGRVFVVGNVRRPGAYPLDRAEDTSVMKVLALAEGLAAYAGKEAYIYRREGNASEPKELRIELRSILKRKAADQTLRAGDVLYVPDASGRRLGLAVLERALLFGSTAGATALIYGQAR